MFCIVSTRTSFFYLQIPKIKGLPYMQFFVILSNVSSPQQPKFTCFFLVKMVDI